VHARTAFGAVHYERWLDLFDTTLDELFAGPTAEVAKGRARRMASAMRRLLNGHSVTGGRPAELLWTRHGDHSQSE
jgi:hemoglobin